MARKKTQTGKMTVYKHFAAWTLITTAVLAVFSDGENRQAIAEEAAQNGANLKRTGQVDVTDDPVMFQKFPDRSGGGDVGGPMGAPMDGSETSGVVPASGEDWRREPWKLLKMTKAEWEALPEERKRQLLAKLQRERPATSEVIEEVVAQSANRSGADNYGSGGDAPG